MLKIDNPKNSLMIEENSYQNLKTKTHHMIYILWAFSFIAQSCGHILAHLSIYTCTHTHVICALYPFWVSFPNWFNCLNVKQILPWLHFILKWMAELELKERHTMDFYFWLSHMCVYIDLRGGFSVVMQNWL